jgi:hypothetical protein
VQVVAGEGQQQKGEEEGEEVGVCVLGFAAAAAAAAAAVLVFRSFRGIHPLLVVWEAPERGGVEGGGGAHTHTSCCGPALWDCWSSHCCGVG